MHVVNYVSDGQDVYFDVKIKHIFYCIEKAYTKGMLIFLLMTTQTILKSLSVNEHQIEIIRIE
jgi:hypothetical protein